MSIYSNLSFTREAQTVGDSETLSAVLNTFGDTLFKRLQCCTPAIVEEYYPGMGMARVRPLVMQVLASGQAIASLPLVVTVLQHQSGNFLVHTPLTHGDTGWLIASDQDSSIAKKRNSYIAGDGAGKIGFQDANGRVLENAGPQRPNTFERHQYSQGFFIPDKWGGIILPENVQESFVIQTIDAAHQTHGRFVLDKDGSVHILSERWMSEDTEFHGGRFDIELRYKGIDLKTNQPYWSSGEVESFANAIIFGDQTIKSWTDEYKIRHGGNLVVEGKVEVGENIGVNGNAHVGGQLDVESGALFKERVVVETDNKKAIIDPKNDLYKTDAKFREITVVTGLHKKEDNTVKLKARKMRALVDEPEDTKDVEFEVGGDGGVGITKVDDVSIGFKPSESEAICIHGWWDQDPEEWKTLAEVLTPEEEEDSDEWSDYEILVRQGKGEALKYLKIGKSKEKKIEGESPIFVTEANNIITIHISGGGDDSDSDSGEEPGPEIIEGLTTSVFVNPRLEWNRTNHTLVLKGSNAKFQNGLLVEIGPQTDIDVIPTTPHSETVISSSN